MTVWFIDDEELIRELFKEVFEDALSGVKLEFISNWNQCEQLKGDIVVHDLCGVGKQKRIEGVDYYTCSGSMHLISDFPKPFNFELMIETLSDRINRNS